MTILLRDIWAFPEPEIYKIHFARWDEQNQPLDVWTRDRAEWKEWQEYWPGRNDFNRPYIFSLIQFYHEPDIWLFGGVFKVLNRLEERYEVELTDQGKGMAGRLKLRSRYRNRTARVNFENHCGDFEVQEILREPYSGRVFPGYEGIDVSFEELEVLVKNNRQDWKVALESIKGIYLITDISTSKRYVGSAYGDSGIWSRWSSYVSTGHGGNIELKSLASDPSLDYCRKSFRFALLESRPPGTADEVLLAREAFWKTILLTRGVHGLNRN